MEKTDINIDPSLGDCQKPYLMLFNAITDIRHELAQIRFSLAKLEDTLAIVQAKAEDMILEDA